MLSFRECLFEPSVFQSVRNTLENYSKTGGYPSCKTAPDQLPPVPENTNIWRLKGWQGSQMNNVSRKTFSDPCSEEKTVPIHLLWAPGEGRAPRSQPWGLSPNICATWESLPREHNKPHPSWDVPTSPSSCSSKQLFPGAILSYHPGNIGFWKDRC